MRTQIDLAKDALFELEKLIGYTEELEDSIEELEKENNNLQSEIDEINRREP